MASFANLCGSLSTDGRNHLLAKHILPLLDTIELPDETREKLTREIAKTQDRWAKYPQPCFGKRREEIIELIHRLKQNTKLKQPVDGITTQNETLVELMHALLDWTKELYIVGVEYGQQMDFVHESLLFMANTVPQINGPTVANCTCIVPLIKVHHEFIRTDGDIIEEFSGAADHVILSCILTVWRDLILAQLVRPENQEDTSWFVMNRLRDMLKDIVGVKGFSISTLFLMLNPSDDGDSDGDSDEVIEDDDDYTDSDYVTDDGESDEEMPPLVDIDGSSSDESDMPPLVPIGATGNSATMSSNMAPPSGTLPTTTVSSAPSDSGSDSGESDDDGTQSDEGSTEDDSQNGSEDEDEDEEPSELTLELDDEMDERDEALPRLRALIEDFAVEQFKVSPSHAGFTILMEHCGSRKKELLDHLADMPHSHNTFNEALHLLVKEKATPQLVKVVPANLHLASRAPSAIQEVVVYYSQRQSTKSLVAPLLNTQIENMIKDMVVEVEAAFNGLVSTPDKKAEVQDIMKMTSAERPAVIKTWVDSVVSLIPESLSPEAQSNTAPPPTDPFGLFAALSATLGWPNADGSATSPLFSDPIEAFDPDPNDLDFEPLYQRYRPEFSVLFETWMSTLKEVGKVDRASAAVGIKVYAKLAEVAPYVSYKGFVTEMKARCNNEKRDHVLVILTQLHSFATTQLKAISAAKKAAQKSKAKANANASSPAASNATQQANSPGLRDFVSAPGPSSSPSSSTPLSASTSSAASATPGLPAGFTTLSLPPDVSNMLLSALGMSSSAPPPTGPSAPGYSWDDVD